MAVTAAAKHGPTVALGLLVACAVIPASLVCTSGKTTPPGLFGPGASGGAAAATGDSGRDAPAPEPGGDALAPRDAAIIDVGKMEAAASNGAQIPDSGSSAEPGALPDRPDTAASRPDRADAAPCTGPQTPLEPSLAASPSLLWSAEIPSLGVVSQVAVAADLAAVSTGSWLSIYDRQGALKGRWRNPSFSRLSAPTAGPNGRFYVASNIAAAVDGDGKELWTLPLRRDDVFRRPESKPFVMSPEGVLYSLQPDGVLVAIPAAVGYPVYRKPITTADYWDVNPLRITGGVGSWLVLSGVPTRGFMIADAKNGDVLWQVTHPEAKADNIAFLGAWSVIRGLGVWVADLNPSRQRRRGLWGWIGETQPSLELRWDVAVEPESFLELELVDHRGNLVFIEGSQPRGAGGRERFITMGCDGRTITEAPLDPGPSAYFTAFALGADGLVYGLTRNRYNNAEGVKLVVFDRSLRPLRTHEFKDARLGNLGEPSLVISKDGILYLALEAKDGTGRLHAIQTTSPGLAATPLSTFRHDAAGTGWTVSR